MNRDFETFRQFDDWAVSNFTLETPGCLNGQVRFRKYRVQVTQVEETVEALGARLQILWENSDNSHDMRPLKEAAKSIGYTLKGGWGDARFLKKKKA